MAKRQKLNKQEIEQWTENQAMQFGRDHANGETDFEKTEMLEASDFFGSHMLFYAYQAGFQNPDSSAGAAAGSADNVAMAKAVTASLKKIGDAVDVMSTVAGAGAEAAKGAAKSADRAATSAQAAADAATAATQALQAVQSLVASMKKPA